MANPYELITPHFKTVELACPCCGKMNMPKAMLDFLERCRINYGKPMKINSAVRCAIRNHAVGGTINSAHLQGLAVDVAIKSTTMRLALVKAALDAKVVNIGIYPTFLHLDIMNKIQGPNMFVKGDFNDY